MSVCACGRLTPKGAGWCRKCYLFWALWWTRYVDPGKCDCFDCKRQLDLQPMFDAAETRVIRSIGGKLDD